MNKKAVILIVVFLFVGIAFWFGKKEVFPQTATKGELKIKANPPVSAFLDGENLGRTPYEGKVKSGEHELKLIPQENDSLPSWQQRIEVAGGTQTYVNVNLGPSEITSSWAILSLKKIKRGETEITIFSKTDSGEVFLDGERRGTVPLSFQKIPPGEHELKITASGFHEQVIKIKITRGYKLVVNTQLALKEEKPAEEETGGGGGRGEEGPYVLIKETPTGWLRVREEASTASKELSKVNPGEKFPFLEEEKGWYKIEYESGKEGWVSGRYAQKIE